MRFTAQVQKYAQECAKDFFEEYQTPFDSAVRDWEYIAWGEFDAQSDIEEEENENNDHYRDLFINIFHQETLKAYEVYRSSFELDEGALKIEVVDWDDIDVDWDEEFEPINQHYPTLKVELESGGTTTVFGDDKIIAKLPELPDYLKYEISWDGVNDGQDEAEAVAIIKVVRR